MGWIEVRGLPFYLLFEKYLFHLADGERLSRSTNV